MNVDDVNINEILETDDCAETGYFVDVDLHYPDGIIEKTKNFPLCPSHLIFRMGAAKATLSRCSSVSKWLSKSIPKVRPILQISHHTFSTVLSK